MELESEMIIMRKKLSIYLSDKGRLKNVPEELLYELLNLWENWSGKNSKFYQAIGFTQRQMAKLLGKAKKVKRDGYFGKSDFKELKVDSIPMTEAITSTSIYAEIIWNGNYTIRFNNIDLLLEFLKKAS